MPDITLGKKWTCFHCRTKFYDLNREAICPKCGQNQMNRPAIESKVEPPTMTVKTSGSFGTDDKPPLLIDNEETVDESDEDYDEYFYEDEDTDADTFDDE